MFDGEMRAAYSRFLDGSAKERRQQQQAQQQQAQQQQAQQECYAHQAAASVNACELVPSAGTTAVMPASWQ